MISFGTRLWAAAGAALLTTTFALPASAAMAGTSALARSEQHARPAIVHPDSSGSCHNNPLGIYKVVECTSVTGTGLHIDSLQGNAENETENNIPALHIELYGPKGFIKNCPDFNLGPGKISSACTWSPNDTRAAGNYCSEVWQNDGGGTYSKLSVECIDVHS